MSVADIVLQILSAGFFQNTLQFIASTVLDLFVHPICHNKVPLSGSIIWVQQGSYELVIQHNFKQYETQTVACFLVT